MDTRVHPRLNRAALFIVGMMMLGGLSGCGGSGETILPSGQPEHPLTFTASDAAKDCFSARGQRADCAGLDLLRLDVGLPQVLPELPDDLRLPVGFVVSFAGAPATEGEFALYLYMDLDQNESTGLDMSTETTVLRGIDRLIGVDSPSGEAWTQVLATNGDKSEIVRDPARLYAQVLGEKIVVVVERALLMDSSVAVGKGQTPPTGATAAWVALDWGTKPGGGTPDAFDLFIGARRGAEVFDYFDSGQDIHAALRMTVPQEVMYPPGAAGGS